MSLYWLVEHGIGEDRAALIDNGDIVAARIRRHDNGPFAGAVISGRLKMHPAPHLLTEQGKEIALAGPLGDLSEGAQGHARIIRERLGEASGDHRRTKPPRGRLVDGGSAQPAPLLAETLPGDYPHQTHIIAPSPAPDILAQAGWYELVEEAMSGVITFAEGRLIISPTPGMTVIDIDGSAAGMNGLTGLAKAAAVQAARAIIRHDIGGAIAIDFPTIESRADRQSVAAIFDGAMTGAFERTAINGFGLMQIVRRRERPSFAEHYQLAPARGALLLLLRRAQRDPNLAQSMLAVDAVGAQMLKHNVIWLEQLQRMAGVRPDISITASGPADYHVAPKATAT